MSKYLEPILITGCARSGTSMTAGIIDMSGAFGGDMAGPNSNNKKGMFENTVIRQEIKKPLLRALKVDPLGQDPLPSDEQIRSFTNGRAIRLRFDVLSVMKAQGLLTDMTWFYKGAKMCLTWTLWNMAFPEAKWVIVRRNDEDIVASCLRTSFMRAYTTDEGWHKWVRKHLQRFNEMKEAGLQVREVWPQKMIDGDFSEIREVIEWLGLYWNELRAKQFVAPELWME